MDKLIRKFAQDIINKINEYDLPLEVKRLVLSDIYIKVSEASNRAIEEEAKLEEQEESDE